MEKQIFTKDVQAVLEKQYELMTEEEKAQFDASLAELTDEQREQLDKSLKQQLSLAEIFSQCWDDADFKAEFMADPKAMMDKYGVEYDDNIDYVIVDNDPKTITYVLPFTGVKEVVDTLADEFKEKVADVVEGKQIIPENWSIKFIQNTEDINYIVIPMSPENLTPEELEFVNGCGFFSWLKKFCIAQVFIFAQAVLVMETAVAGSVVVAGLIAAVAVYAVVTMAAAVYVIP